MSAHNTAAAASPSRLSRLAADRWAALPVVLAGVFLVVLDFFIVNVALPSMQTDLHASSGSIEWVVAGYGLTLATLMITAGRLGDRYGRRRMFSLGVALFTFASIACGLAASPTQLVVARLAQGAAAALITPQALSIIGVLYTGADRVRALSAYGIVLGMAALLGQLIGGVLVERDVAGLGWRAVFWINVPVGIAVLVLAPRLIPESRSPAGGRVDLTGTVLVTAGLVAVVLPLVEGRSQGWPLWTWLSLAAAPALLAAFALQQGRLSERGGAPLLDPALFRVRTFSAGLLAQLVFWSTMASFFFVLALYLQQGRGLNALEAGLVFTIMASAYLATSLKAPELTLRYGRSLIAVGALLLAAGHALMAVTVSGIGADGSIALLAPALLVIGAGMGLCITPLTSTVMASMEPAQAGAASGALSTMQQVGNALGVAITGVIFFGAVDEGFAYAFELSVAQLALLAVAVVALTRLLPAHKAPSDEAAAPAPASATA